MDIFKKRYKHAVSKATATHTASKKQLVLSIVSLFLAVLMLGTGTVCWFTLHEAKGSTDNINLTVGNGLRVNDLGTHEQKFNDDSVLLPASSVDGRNLFFPTDGTDFSTQTQKMTFRSANAGDRNYDYVQLDFNLTAEANYTSIYLDKTTSVKIEVPDDASDEYIAQAAQAEKAIRTAIYYDGMDQPVVFTSQMNPCSVNAVKDIDRTTGRFIESKTQLAVPFKDYSYGKHQLAMLNQGETRPFSLIIWLEGTDEENCVSSPVMLKQLKLNLKFTTSWDNTIDITFDDITSGGKVAELLQQHPEYSLVLNYNNDAHKIYNLKFTMHKIQGEDKQWTCKVPGNAYNDLSFMILDGSNNNAEIVKWSQNENGSSTLNRGTATKYFGDSIGTASAGVYTGSYGHWYDGEIETHGEGRDEQIVDDDW